MHHIYSYKERRSNSEGGSLYRNILAVFNYSRHFLISATAPPNSDCFNQFALYTTICHYRCCARVGSEWKHSK